MNAPAGDTSILVRRRAGGYRDRARAYKVLVDGTQVGTVKAGGEVTVPVTPGPHVVKLQVDWMSSPDLTVNVSPGAQSSVECEPGGSAMMALFALFSPGTYIKVAESTTGGVAR